MTGQGGPRGRSHLSQFVPSKITLGLRTGSSSTPKGSPALLKSTQSRDLEENLRHWRAGQVVKNTDCSFRRLGFHSQNLPDISHLSVTPVSGYLIPFSDLRGHQAHVRCV